MRILRLVAEGEFAIEFHPYVTVVTELDDDRRNRVVRAFEEAATGRTTPLRGLIDVHGVVLDLDERSLDLLELDDSEAGSIVVSDDLRGNASNTIEQHDRDRLDGQIEDLQVARSIHRLYDPRPIQEALDDLRVPAATASPIERLGQALAAVGLPVVGLDLSDDEIETMAADWLAEYEQAESRVARRTAQLDTPDEVSAAMDEDPQPVGEMERCLLARLAAQRLQSFVGSLPLVIARALDDVPNDEDLEHLLDRLEQMAGAVQIVHITDDPRIVDWASSPDDGRRAVVRPVPVPVPVPASADPS